MILNNYAALGVARQSGVLVIVYRHGALGLVACHLSEYHGADGTLCPFVLPNEVHQTSHMVFVRALKHIDIFITLLS